MRKWILLSLVFLVGCNSSPTELTAQHTGKLTGTWIGSASSMWYEADLEQRGTAVTGTGGGLLPPESAAVPIPFSVSGSNLNGRVRLDFTVQFGETSRFEGEFTDASTVVGTLFHPPSSTTYKIEMRRQAVRAGSGIEGIVTIGPLCPVEGGPDCQQPDAPYVATLVFRSPSGTEVGRTTSAADGRYAIALPAGTYNVEGLSDARPGGFPIPPVVDNVIVHPEQWTRLDLGYDTGIR